MTGDNNNSRQQKKAPARTGAKSKDLSDGRPDRASQRNNFQIIPLSRPRIERAVDCDGFYVLRDDHGWLCGDRRQALTEFAGLERVERLGST